MKKKELYFEEFSKTMNFGDNQVLSFYSDLTLVEEFELLFKKIIAHYGKKHIGIYRMCDAEYMYCVGRIVPPQLPIFRKLKYAAKTVLIKSGFLTQKTGHENKVNNEFWFGEHYSLIEKKMQKEKFLKDLRQISNEGFLAPHFVYSKSHFAEEYIQPMINFLKENSINLNKDNYFAFYFVYMMLNLERYKKLLYQGKKVLIVTAFNERNKQENFTANLLKEGVTGVYFYNISHDKSMLDVIDTSKLPQKVDLVLIGAGIGSANIINQLKHLDALCIDAGHALDCISRPQLRIERMFLLPDVEMNSR